MDIWQQHQNRSPIIAIESSPLKLVCQVWGKKKGAVNLFLSKRMRLVTIKGEPKFKTTIILTFWTVWLMLSFMKPPELWKPGDWNVLDQLTTMCLLILRSLFNILWPNMRCHRGFQLSYSSGLTLWHFSYSPLTLKGRKFNGLERVIGKSTEQIQGQLRKASFRNCFLEWAGCWSHCVASRTDCCASKETSTITLSINCGRISL